MHEKFCPKCRTTKPVEQFYRNSARRDGLGVYCAACQQARDTLRVNRHRSNLRDLLGGCCVSCGYDDHRALHVDHVDGDGAERRRSGLDIGALALLRQATLEPGRFQLLCANCNIIKKLERLEMVGIRVYERTAPAVRSLRSGDFSTKFCPRCSTDKPTTDFNRAVRRHDGLSGYCAACMRQLNADLAARQRAQLVDALGGCCATCGFTNPLALQVDHVNGNGNAHRRALNSHSRTLLRLATESPSAFQLLCANCNNIKRIVMGEHVGERKYARAPLTERVLKGRGAENARRTAAADQRAAAIYEEAEKRRAQERSAERLPFGSWSRHYHRCLACLSNDRKHSADGFCSRCYRPAARHKDAIRSFPSPSERT